MFDKKSIDQEILAICEKLLERALSCKIEKGKIRVHSNKIHEDQLFILFVLPGMLIIALSSIAGNKKHQNIIRAMEEILDRETDYQKILNGLIDLLSEDSIPNYITKKIEKFTDYDKKIDELIESMNEDIDFDNIAKTLLQLDKVNDPEGYEKLLKKEMRRYLPPGIEAMMILLNPRVFQIKALSIYFEKTTIFDALIFSFGNYFMLAMMTYVDFPSYDEGDFLYSEDVAAMLYICDEKIGAFNEFNVFTDVMQTIAEGTINQLKDNNKTYKYQRTIVVTPLDLNFYLHEYAYDNENFYILDQSSAFQNEFKFTENKSIGFAINTNIFNEFDFELIVIVTINDHFCPMYECLKGTYLFIKPKQAGSDNFSFFANQLYQMAKKCSSVISSIMDSWKGFIDQPGYTIGSDFAQFENWLTSVLYESCETREELFRSASLSRMIGNIDTEIFSEGADKARNLFKEAKFHHIPIELKQKLLDADKELKTFVHYVISKRYKKGIGWIVDHDELLEYIKSKKTDYEYLRLLDDEDIERIDFGTGENILRDNRRKILPRIYQEITGKKYDTMSELTKKLGLESGKESYMKWTK